MSRTYRRKNSHEDWYAWDWDFTGAIFVKVYLKGGDLKKAKAIFHSDSEPWAHNSPPPEFRRLYGHKHDRAQAREAIHKEMKALERGDVIFNKTMTIAWIWD